MAKQLERHNITDSLYIYKQANSKRFYARFKVNGVWYTKATKECEIQPATFRAVQIQTEYQTKLDNGLNVAAGSNVQHGFTTVAKHAIDRLNATKNNNTWKVIYRDYIQALNKYHMPYFEKTQIKDIDQQALINFDNWRSQQMGRTPAKSTVLTHNSAMQRVLDEAVIRKIITSTELPMLENEGKGGERRAAFSKTEYYKLLAAAKDWMNSGKKQITRDTRTLLYYYIQFATGTGIRPGKEIEQLTWGDIHTYKEAPKEFKVVTVRKGKTTLYTGTRIVVCKDVVSSALESLNSLNKNTGHDDLIFALPNGEKPKEIGRNFTKLVDMNGLKNSAYGVRTLYSLRHSYITWELQAGTPLPVIGKQCGTSAEMIEKHYSHLVPTMFAEELSGRGGTLNLTSSSDLDMPEYNYDNDKGTLDI